MNLSQWMVSMGAVGRVREHERCWLDYAHPQAIPLPNLDIIGEDKVGYCLLAATGIIKR